MGVATIALIALLLLKPGGGTSSLATQVPTTYLGPAATFTPPSAATATQAATLPPTATRTPSPIPTDTPTATPPYPPPVTPTLAITFAIEMPSQIREAGAFNAMAFDSSGTPYLVFNKGNPDLGGPFDKDQLYYAFRQSNSAWISREITNGAKNEGFSNALAADASGNLHLATYSYEDQIIYYSVRRRGAAGWDSLRPLASVLRGKDAAGSSNVPPPVSIAVSPNGTAHIAYFDYVNERLMYISTAGGGAREVASGLSAEGGSFPIVVDAEGRPVIAFYNPISTAQNKAGLQVARLTGSAWKYETVAANPSGSAAKVGLQPALATDEQGYVYLAYFDGYESALMLTVYDGTGWQPPILVDDQGGQYTKMAVDSQSGTVHLAYYQKNALTLNYAAGNASAFAEPKVILSDVPLIDENKKEAKHLALALDARGNPWISFFDPDDMLLKVFRPAAP